MSWWENIGFNTVFGILSTVIKNPEKKAKYKETLFNLYQAIGNAFPEFKQNG